MNTLKAYEEVIDFIAAGTTPSSVIDFTPSESVKERVASLIFKEKTTGLSAEEKSELDLYMQLEHLMRLVKAKRERFDYTKWRKRLFEGKTVREISAEAMELKNRTAV